MVESSNAWERAQEAITRASERSDAVVTPDNAVSPFDASKTMAIPYADVVRRGTPDPDSTQRLSYSYPPAPRPPVDGRARNGHAPNGHAPNGHAPGGRAAGQHRAPGQHREPPPRPPELSDPSMPRVQNGRPGTAPFPAAPLDDGTPPQGLPAQDGSAGESRRPWWKRLFGR